MFFFSKNLVFSPCLSFGLFVWIITCRAVYKKLKTQMQGFDYGG